MEYSYFIVERLFVEDNGPIEGNRGNSPICFLLLRPSETQYTQMFARIIRKFPAQRLTRLVHEEAAAAETPAEEEKAAEEPKEEEKPADAVNWEESAETKA